MAELGEGAGPGGGFDVHGCEESNICYEKCIRVKLNTGQQVKLFMWIHRFAILTTPLNTLLFNDLFLNETFKKLEISEHLHSLPYVMQHGNVLD